MKVQSKTKKGKNSIPTTHPPARQRRGIVSSFLSQPRGPSSSHHPTINKNKRGKKKKQSKTPL
jgi:hypothetical protein